MEITGIGSVCSQGPEQNGRRRQTLFRWNVRTNESRELVRELYPHFVAKLQQGRILYGCPSSGEKAEAAHAALIGLHRGSQTFVDFPAPPSCFEPGWYLRSDVVWSKPNPMPESVTDRPTRSHEYIFLLSKRERYFYDAQAIKEAGSPLTARCADVGKPNKAALANPEMNHNGTGATGLHNNDKYRDIGRNKRSVWTINSEPTPEAHFATFPQKLIEPCILAGSRPGDLVLDPFLGSGTVGKVCERLGRRWVGLELSESYIEIARNRTAQRGLGI